jgi:hypothetical protein
MMKNDEAGLSPAASKTLTCLADPSIDDGLARQIRTDIAGRTSVLDLMKGYMADLRGELDNDALPFRKLQRLFELGSTPDRLEGHHSGVALGLRTGGLHGVAAEYGNLLGAFWAAAIGGVCPWVGKSFAPMDSAGRGRIAGGAVPAETPVSAGINHFHLLKRAPVNVASNALLTFLWHLKRVSDAEEHRFGHQRNGGPFAACRAPSVYALTPREVLRLNYRFRVLGNPPPLAYLIDELVGIAEGLYLGQLLFATARLLEPYAPEAPKEVYRYHHFGYFLLFREGWNAEAKRLFPHLGLPDAAVADGSASSWPAAKAPASGRPGKFNTLSLADPPEGDVDPAVLDEVRSHLSASDTILHLLKAYSDDLGSKPDTESPAFARLHTLFNAGIGPGAMEGFYRGANIAFQSQGLLSAFNVNTLNAAWQWARFFSPWTGKRFDPIDGRRLSELTGGYEKSDLPTAFGSNTVVFRTPREKFVRSLMAIGGMWIEESSDEERRACGYDGKTFFFIGKAARTILSENRGKTVYQFNYRWKALRTPPPDNGCVDELVRIAEGLFLGKLIYATDVLKPWDPETDPLDYRYRLFGYFLLMDEEWHALRLRIGFDLDNT